MEQIREIALQTRPIRAPCIPIAMRDVPHPTPASRAAATAAWP